MGGPWQVMKVINIKMKMKLVIMKTTCMYFMYTMIQYATKVRKTMNFN